MPKVSVVIPFYQRKKGLLRNAVLSALSQKTSAQIEVVVVDDGSPVPARNELADLIAKDPQSIILVEQKNTGNPAASNAGIDNASPDTDFIAFLDSDDTWTDCHIEHAVWALSHGYDLYFSDFYQLGQTVTAFNRAGRIRLQDHKKAHPSEPIYEYVGDMVNQILTGNVFGVSTIIYNFKKFHDLRYRTDYRHTGMEYILFVHLAQGSSKIAFGAEPECRYGPGVNIFSDSGWGTDKYLSVLHDNIKYKKYLLANMNLTPFQRATLENGVKQHRTNYGKGFLHNLLHNHRVDQNLVWKQLKSDPMTLLSMASSPAILVIEKFRRPSAD